MSNENTDGSRSGGEGGLADAIEANLEYLQNHEYNPFEPDNQSQAFSVVVKLSGQLAPILAALRQPTQSDALQAENERLREHLISALDTLKDAEVCDDTCGPCNEARAALDQSK